MDCIILAGGLGTRLRTAVHDRPKPLALIQGVPFLSLLMRHLGKTGLVSKAVVAVGYQAKAIVDFFSESPLSLPVEFSYEEQLVGTGGAVQKALEKTNSESVLVLNGDSYIDFSLASFFETHQSLNRDATLVYTSVPDAARFGKLDIDEKAKTILAFKEKSSSPGPGFINAGVYLFRRSLFEKYSLPEAFSLERELFPQLVLAGMGAFYAPGAFIDIGTPDSYQEAQHVLKSLVQAL